MKPTQEQVIAWAQEACGDPAWEGGVEWVWGEVRRFAALAYEAGRKDENEACAKVCESAAVEFEKLCNKYGYEKDKMYANKMLSADNLAAAIRARREQ